MHYGNGIPVVGLTTVDVTQPFTMPIVVFDDFLGDGHGTNNFNTTQVGRYLIGGTNATATSAALINTDTLPGGWVRLTPAGADGDETNILHNTAKVSWANGTALPSGDPLPWVFQSRVRINSITTARQCVGVGPYNGTNPMETLPTGSVFFTILNGAVSFIYKTSATTATATALTYEDTGAAVTVAAAGIYTFRITWDGLNTIEMFVASGVGGNLRRVKKFAPAAFTASNITVFAGTGAIGGAVAPTLDVDYFYLAQPRTKTGA